MIRTTIKIAINYASCVIIVVHWYNSNIGHEIDHLLSKHRLPSTRGASNTNKYYPAIVLRQKLAGTDHNKEAFLKRQWITEADNLIAIWVLPFHQLDLVSQKIMKPPWWVSHGIMLIHCSLHNRWKEKIKDMKEPRKFRDSLRRSKHRLIGF